MLGYVQKDLTKLMLTIRALINKVLIRQFKTELRMTKFYRLRIFAVKQFHEETVYHKVSSTANRYVTILLTHIIFY